MSAPQRSADRLTEVKETLFIPLYSRVLAGRSRDPILTDPVAERILREVGYSFEKIDAPVWSHIALALRARHIDDLVRGFVEQHPDAVVLHLACGLDSRAERIAPAPRAWYDVDYPEVIALRRRFYTEREGYRMIGASVLDPEWISEVAASGPTMIVAEGLMMYLSPSEVRELVLRLHTRFPGAELVFDAFSPRAARQIGRHRSIVRTGARIRWWIDDGREVERWASGIRLLDEWSPTRSPHLAKVSWPRRVIFRLAGMVRAGRIAHRVLHYRL